jgi:hypothetical protein
LVPQAGIRGENGFLTQEERGRIVLQSDLHLIEMDMDPSHDEIKGEGLLCVVHGEVSCEPKETRDQVLSSKYNHRLS